MAGPTPRVKRHHRCGRFSVPTLDQIALKGVEVKLDRIREALPERLCHIIACRLVLGRNSAADTPERSIVRSVGWTSLARRALLGT